jgi:hypothetical protein
MINERLLRILIMLFAGVFSECLFHAI